MRNYFEVPKEYRRNYRKELSNMLIDGGIAFAFIIAFAYVICI